MESDTPATADLTRTEALLFDALRSRPGVVWSRRELLEAMHGKTRGNAEHVPHPDRRAQIRTGGGEGADAALTAFSQMRKRRKQAPDLHPSQLHGQISPDA